MDEADVTQKARAFVAKVDVSGIREDLTPYVVAANAKVKKEELSEGESGYTITKPNGKHVITVNSLETEERQRFTICHEIAHIVLALESSHEEVPSWSSNARCIRAISVAGSGLVFPRCLTPAAAEKMSMLMEGSFSTNSTRRGSASAWSTSHITSAASLSPGLRTFSSFSTKSTDGFVFSPDSSRWT